MSGTLENAEVVFGWLSSYTAHSPDEFTVHTEAKLP